MAYEGNASQLIKTEFDINTEYLEYSRLYDKDYQDGLVASSTSQKMLNIDKQESNKGCCSCSEVLDAVKANQKSNIIMFQWLTDEIINLKNKLNDDEAVNAIPLMHFETVDDFLVFDKMLQDSTGKFNELKNYFIQYGRNFRPEYFIKNNLKKFFDDNLAKKFSWRGSESKPSARLLTTVAALRNAFHESYDLDDEYFDNIALRHFQYANSRLKSKQYKNQ